MEALQAAIALSEAVSVDSDTSKILEGAADKPGGQRRRKQRAPMRSAFSSDTPSETQQQQAAAKQQAVIQPTTSSGDSPVLNNTVGLELPPATKVQSSRSSKSSPAQRQGPCGHCKTPYSPQWRKGPRNKPVLCNACGIRYLRNRHLGRAVPQKKRTTSALGAKAAAADSAGEASVDTLTDTTDMRGPSKKRRTKQAETGDDEDTSNYSYDASAQETMGSVGSLQQLLHHQEFNDIDQAAGGCDDAGMGNSSDATHPVSVSGISTAEEAHAQADTAAAAADGAQATFGTSVAMPGNMQPLLVPLNSIAASSSNLYGGSYNMALALQLYQQQQQQQLLYGQQHMLLTQASTGNAGLQTSGSVPSSGLSAGSMVQADSSQPGSPAHVSSAGRMGSAPTLLYTQSLQAQQLQGYLLQQHQHAQQAQLLQAAGMLHGPSPLSVMSSANMASFCLGTASSLSNMLQAPVSAGGAAPAPTRLEIAPLVCSDRPLSAKPMTGSTGGAVGAMLANTGSTGGAAAGPVLMATTTALTTAESTKVL